MKSFYLKEEYGEYTNKYKIYGEIFISYCPDKKSGAERIIRIIFEHNENLKDELEKILHTIFPNIDEEEKTKGQNISVTSSLEKIIKQNEENLFKPIGLQIPHYYGENGTEEVDTNGAQVFGVPLYSLPHGPGGQVYGMYDPDSHEIYVANDVDSITKEWILYHESGHAHGIPGTPEGEARADAYATAKMGGYDPFQRRLRGNSDYN